MGREPRPAGEAVITDVAARRAGAHTRVAALDGLRGLAVAAVLLYHSQFSWARGGFLGVSAFFTLSGFLITGLLLGGTGARPATRLRDFWARRVRRLLPASMLTLFGVLLFGATIASGDQLRMLRGDVLATLGYVANWRFYVSGQSYAQLFSQPSPVLHFWSLAIEEQFYLVFPLLVALVMRVGRRGSYEQRRRVLGVVLAAGIAASVIASRALYPTHGSARVYYGTDTRAAELLVGALLAVVLARRAGADSPPAPRVRLVLTFAGTGALGVMAWWWSTVDQSASWLYHGGFALHACCAAIVIVAARVDNPLSRALAWRPLAGLGLISYGVYLFHWPIFLWLSPERTGLAAGPLLAVRLALTLTLAIASYRFVEQPILRGERLRRPRIRIAIPATALGVIAVLFLVTASLPAPNIVFAPLSARASSLETGADVQAARATTPAPPPPPAKIPLFRPFTAARPFRVLVVGDSVGQTLGRGFELWGYTTGRAEVENDAIPLCSLGRVLPRELPLGQVADPSPTCADWTQSWPKTLATFNPDVVVVLYSVWEAEARELPSGRFARPGDPELDRWQLGEYRAAADVLAARGAPVLWFDVACEGEPVKPGDLFWTLDYQTIPALAASRPAVHEVDMNHLLCPAGPPDPDFGGVTAIRPDSAHFTDAGALAVAKYLMPIILGEAPAPKRIFPLALHVPIAAR